MFDLHRSRSILYAWKRNGERADEGIHLLSVYGTGLWAQDRPKNRDENLTVAMRHRFGSAMGIMRCFLPYTVDPSECFARVNFIASDVDIFIGLVTEVKTAARHETRNSDENQEIRTDSSANLLGTNRWKQDHRSIIHSQRWYRNTTSARRGRNSTKTSWRTRSLL